MKTSGKVRKVRLRGVNKSANYVTYQVNADGGLDFTEFFAKYRKRVQSQACNMARGLGLSEDQAHDLEQSAWLSISKTLPYWRENRGRRPYTFCVDAMKSEMYNTARLLRGYRRFQRTEMTALFCEYEDECCGPSIDTPQIELSIEEKIDLHRVLQSDPKRREVIKFIMYTLSPTMMASDGRKQQVTRQAIFSRKEITRKRLRAAMHHSG